MAFQINQKIFQLECLHYILSSGKWLHKHRKHHNWNTELIKKKTDPKFKYTTLHNIFNILLSTLVNVDILGYYKYPYLLKHLSHGTIFPMMNE